MRYLPGYSTVHHERLTRTLISSLTRGTWRNKHTQVAKFLVFMNDHKADPLNLKEYDLLSYVLHLQSTLRSPSSVHNYLSGVRTWLQSLNASTKAFASYRAVLMIRALNKHMAHTPRQAEPVSPCQVKVVVKFLDKLGKKTCSIKVVFLLAYFTLLRQSNLLPRSRSDPAPHLLARSDIAICKSGLCISVRSSKTITSPDQIQNIWVPATADPALCPRRAWKVLNQQRTDVDSRRAFVLPDGSPLTLRLATKVIKLALQGSDFKEPGKFTFHGLRRGAAQACARAGVPLDQIMELGNWRSKAVHTYVPRSLISAATSTLKGYFA